MSMYEEVAVVVATGAAAVGGGAAVVAAGIVIGAAAAVAVPVVAVAGIGYGIAKGTKALIEKNKEETKAYKEAMGEYKAKVKENKASEKQFVDKVKDAIKPALLTSEDASFLNKMNDPDELANLLSIQNYLSKLDSVLSNASSSGFKLEKEEEELSSLQQKIDRKIKMGRFHFEEEARALSSLLSKVKDKFASIEDASLIQKVKPMMMAIENLDEDPLLVLFHNELRELLESSVHQEEEIDYEKELVLRKEKIAELVDECSGISHPCKAMEDFNVILSKVEKQLSDPSLSPKTKIELTEIHYPWLLDSYLKLKSDYAWFEKAKKEFGGLEEYYLSCCALLNLAPEQVDLDFSKPKESIASLKAKIAPLEQPAQDKAKVDLTLKGIGTVMKRKGFTHLASSKNETKKGVVYREVYHLENGNVVTFFVTPDSFRYTVSGVKIDGTEKDTYSINQSQAHMCQINREIEKILALYGLKTKVTEVIAPDARYAKEIELKDVSYEKMEFIKSEKRHRTSAKAKEKHMGEGA